MMTADVSGKERIQKTKGDIYLTGLYFYLRATSLLGSSNPERFMLTGTFSCLLCFRPTRDSLSTLLDVSANCAPGLVSRNLL